MVFGGEASYSLYLLHYWVLHTETQPRVASLGYGARVFWLIVAMAAAILLSRAVYVLFERPAMRFFRSGAMALPLVGRRARPLPES
jgi:peptidoglycan/LPS O-acetylase OafA/YrhL